MYRPLTVCLLALAVTACTEDTCDDEVYLTSYEPVILPAAEWRTDNFLLSDPLDVCDPTAFYVYGDLLLVMDRSKGLHVIDNSDNDNPRPLAFLDIPGGGSMAVRNELLYVSQYIDLLTFSLRDAARPELISRTENVFNLSSYHSNSMLANGDIIVDFVEGTETIAVDCNRMPHGDEYVLWNDVVFATNNRVAMDAFNATGGQTPTGETVGIGGSLARFAINEGTLYVVEHDNLRVFSLADPTQPEFVGLESLAWGVETIFPYKDMLFIGAETGMHIFGLEDPHHPEYLSMFQHVRSCDPVVVQDDIAYVTMWGGGSCGSAQDQLMVVDVHDPRSPALLQEIPMTNSHGLGVDGNKLFLCTGPDGLKVFELGDQGRVERELHGSTDFSAKDVIVLPGRNELIVLGWDQAGIRQFDYDAEGLPTPVSEIVICN